MEGWAEEGTPAARSPVKNMQVQWGAKLLKDTLACFQFHMRPGARLSPQQHVREHGRYAMLNTAPVHSAGTPAVSRVVLSSSSHHMSHSGLLWPLSLHHRHSCHTAFAHAAALPGHVLPPLVSCDLLLFFQNPIRTSSPLHVFPTAPAWVQLPSHWIFRAPAVPPARPRHRHTTTIRVPIWLCPPLKCRVCSDRNGGLCNTAGNSRGWHTVAQMSLRAPLAFLTGSTRYEIDPPNLFLTRE